MSQYTIEEKFLEIIEEAKDNNTELAISTEDVETLREKIEEITKTLTEQVSILEERKHTSDKDDKKLIKEIQTSIKYNQKQFTSLKINGIDMKLLYEQIHNLTTGKTKDIDEKKLKSCFKQPKKDKKNIFSKLITAFREAIVSTYKAVIKKINKNKNKEISTESGNDVEPQLANTVASEALKQDVEKTAKEKNKEHIKNVAQKLNAVLGTAEQIRKKHQEIQAQNKQMSEIEKNTEHTVPPKKVTQNQENESLKNELKNAMANKKPIHDKKIANEAQKPDVSATSVEKAKKEKQNWSNKIKPPEKKNEESQPKTAPKQEQQAPEPYPKLPENKQEKASVISKQKQNWENIVSKKSKNVEELKLEKLEEKQSAKPIEAQTTTTEKTNIDHLVEEQKNPKTDDVKGNNETIEKKQSFTSQIMKKESKIGNDTNEEQQKKNQTAIK